MVPHAEYMLTARWWWIQPWFAERNALAKKFQNSRCGWTIHFGWYGSLEHFFFKSPISGAWISHSLLYSHHHVCSPNNKWWNWFIFVTNAILYYTIVFGSTLFFSLWCYARTKICKNWIEQHNRQKLEKQIGFLVVVEDHAGSGANVEAKWRRHIAPTQVPHSLKQPPKVWTMMLSKFECWFAQTTP